MRKYIQAIRCMVVFFARVHLKQLTIILILDVAVKQVNFCHLTEHGEF